MPNMIHRLPDLSSLLKHKAVDLLHQLDPNLQIGNSIDDPLEIMDLIERKVTVLKGKLKDK